MPDPNLYSAPRFSAQGPPATSHARYVVLVFLCTLSFVLYLDRVCISQAVVPIQKELQISDTRMGLVLMAFTLAYGLFEVPTGRWGDRFGSRGVLGRIVIWWSLFTALTGAAIGFYSLVALRFLFGAGEAGAYPNVARIMSRWMPAQERGRAQGIVLTCALVGGALAPAVAARLIAYVDWRWTFAIFGLVGVFWAALFYWWFRDEPSEHPAVSASERALIAAGTDPHAASAHSKVPWGLVLSSPNVWLLGTVQTCGAFASYLYMSWFPKYLVAARGADQIEAGNLSSLVLAGGAIGCFSGGFIADRLVRWTGTRVWSRRCYGFGVMSLAAICLALSTQVNWTLGACLCAALASMFAQAQQATWWSVAGEISGKHLGVLFGLMNSLGVVGAMSGQFYFGWFADWRRSLGFSGRAQYDAAFFLYGAVLFVGGCCFLFLNPTRSAVEPRGPHPLPRKGANGYGADSDHDSDLPRESRDAALDA